MLVADGLRTATASTLQHNPAAAATVLVSCTAASVEK